MNKYGGVSWRGVSRRKARKVTKRLARKQERQVAKEVVRY